MQELEAHQKLKMTDDETQPQEEEEKVEDKE